MVFISILIISLFILFAILIFLFIKYDAKKNNEQEDKLYIKLIVSIIFSLIITAVIIFFTAIVFSSTLITNLFFDFNIRWKIILYISLLVIIYSFLFDDLIVKISQYKLGKNHLFFISISLIRIVIFFGIVHAFSINVQKSIVFSLVFALLLLLNDFYDLKEKEKKKQ